MFTATIIVKPDKIRDLNRALQSLSDIGITPLTENTLVIQCADGTRLYALFEEVLALCDMQSLVHATIQITPDALAFAFTDKNTFLPS